MDTSRIQTHLRKRARWLRAYIRRRLSRELASTIDAEDVMQEVWIAAIHNLTAAALRRPSDWNRWLANVARNQLFLLKRVSDCLKRRPGCAAPQQLLSGFLDEPLAPQHSPSREAAFQEAADAIRIAIASLPEPCRTVMELRYLKEYRPAEIAEITGKSVAAVRGLLWRGLQSVREQLDAWDYLSGDGSRAKEPS